MPNTLSPKTEIWGVTVGTDGSLGLLGERGGTGVWAELGGWMRVSTGVGVDGEGWGRTQSAAESVGRGAIELAPGQARSRPIAVVGKGVASVSVVSSVVHVEGVWRPTSLFGIGATCGIHGPLAT